VYIGGLAIRRLGPAEPLLVVPAMLARQSIISVVSIWSVRVSVSVCVSLCVSVGAETENYSSEFDITL